MRKKLMLFFFPHLIITCPAFSQNSLSLYDHYADSASILASAYADYSVNSNGLTGEFYGYFFGTFQNAINTKILCPLCSNGGFIDEATKKRISRKLSVSNRIGADYGYGVFFASGLNFLPGTGKWKTGISFFIDIANRTHADARFSKDLFTMIFYGNKRFAGQNAQLGPFKSQLLEYQQVKLGIIKKNRDDYLYGLGLSYLNGQNHFLISSDKADLYTSETGEEINLDISLNSNQSDTSHNRSDFFRGSGISAELFWQYPYALFSSKDTANAKWKGFVRAEVIDLGFIRFNNRSLTFSKDSMVHFEGVEISGVNSFKDSGITGYYDSLAGYFGSFFKKKAYPVILPAGFYFSLYQQSQNGLFFITGLNTRIFANYFPYVYFTGGKVVGSKYLPSFTLGYGGYGNFNAGVGFEMRVYGFTLRLGAGNIEGIILPKLTGGLSGYIVVKKVF